jgi:hypothetical protein
VICVDYERLPEVLGKSVAAGLIDQKMADGWIGMANAGYGANEQLRRDEAIRSASLAAMTLMSPQLRRAGHRPDGRLRSGGRET